MAATNILASLHFLGVLGNIFLTASKNADAGELSRLYLQRRCAARLSGLQYLAVPLVQTRLYAQVWYELRLCRKSRPRLI